MNRFPIWKTDIPENVKHILLSCQLLSGPQKKYMGDFERLAGENNQPESVAKLAVRLLGGIEGKIEETLSKDENEKMEEEILLGTVRFINYISKERASLLRAIGREVNKSFQN